MSLPPQIYIIFFNQLPSFPGALHRSVTPCTTGKRVIFRNRRSDPCSMCKTHRVGQVFLHRQIFPISYPTPARWLRWAWIEMHGESEGSQCRSDAGTRATRVQSTRGTLRHLQFLMTQVLGYKSMYTVDQRNQDDRSFEKNSSTALKYKT